MTQLTSLDCDLAVNAVGATGAGDSSFKLPLVPSALMAQLTSLRVTGPSSLCQPRASGQLYWRRGSGVTGTEPRRSTRTNGIVTAS
jgi:hypothetical protein